VFSPATGEKVGQVPLAAEADVNAACAAARKAFDEGPWPTTPPAERAAVIGRAVKLLEDRADLFKHLLKLEELVPRHQGRIHRSADRQRRGTNA
jgi:aldehyde dehydrogenase (NAD+)